MTQGVGMGLTVNPVCRLYLKGQHYVLWLREARSDEEGMQKTKATQRQKKSKATKQKHVDEIEQKKREIKEFKTGMHIRIVAGREKTSPIIEKKIESKHNLYFLDLKGWSKTFMKVFDCQSCS